MGNERKSLSDDEMITMSTTPEVGGVAKQQSDADGTDKRSDADGKDAGGDADATDKRSDADGKDAGGDADRANK